MANVFTKRSKKPRTTTLSDYCGHDLSLIKTLPRILSPTRRGNPHPLGLKYQMISQNKQSYGIWAPEQERNSQRMPAMLNHQRWANFSSDPEPMVFRPKRTGHTPVIKYTETTTSRVSFRNPVCVFPDLKPDKGTTRFAYTPGGGPIKGIVPNLFLKDYPPVPNL